MNNFNFHGCQNGDLFTLQEEDTQIKESIDLGGIVLDFGEDGNLVGFEIYNSAKEIIDPKYLEKGSCSEPEKLEISTQDTSNP